MLELSIGVNLSCLFLHPRTERIQGSRCALLEAWQYQSNSRATASTVAGALSGGVVAALTKTRRHVLPSTVLFGLAGFAGQHVFDIVDASHTAGVEATRARGNASEATFLERLASSRWSPIKPLQDDEYENLMREKLVQTDAAIALLDEDIARLKSQHHQENDIASNSR